MGQLSYEIIPTYKDDGLLLRSSLSNKLDYPDWIAQVLFIPDWATISGVFVRKPFRGLGYGKDILHYTQKLAIELHVSAIHVNVYEPSLLKFFHSANFYQARSTQVYDSNKDIFKNLWIMRWSNSVG